MMKCISDWVENIVGKGENAGYQHFLLFPQCFQKASFSGSLKDGIVRKRANSLPNNKMKAFTDNKLNVTTNLKSSLGRLEITDYQHFLFSHHAFKRLFIFFRDLLSHTILFIIHGSPLKEK